MDLLNFCTWYLYPFNDLVIYVEVIIAINAIIIILISFFRNFWFQPLGDWLSLEIFWTFLPILILVFLGFPSLKILYFREIFRFSRKLSLKVTGHQWYWEYNYLEIIFNLIRYPKIIRDFVRLGESSMICLPFNIKIRILLTSEDVIHSWAIPSLGFKIDACPGRLNFFMLLFITPLKRFGQCRELCGSYHRWMPIYLEVTSVTLFLDWVKINNL